MPSNNPKKRGNSRGAKARKEERGSGRSMPGRRTTISGGGGGSNDVSSGGGAGAGIPSSDLNMRTSGRASRGDVQRDREKLFPEAKTKRKSNASDMMDEETE